MPRLLRGMARTAVVAGTATAVSGRVQRRQAERYAGRDAQIYAEREQAYHEAEAAHLPPAPGPAQSGGADDLDRLERLGRLHADGVLTDDEFANEKAKIIGG